MQVQVRCACNVSRTIDTEKVGPWRLRCKQCGDVIYDPTVQPMTPQVEESVEDTQFQRWLEGSGELKVLLSSEGESAPACRRHPDRRVVAACTRCSALLCRSCLDRVDDQFTCADCAVKVAAAPAAAARGPFGRLLAWLGGLLGGRRS